jgi:hypothetical protein
MIISTGRVGCGVDFGKISRAENPSPQRIVLVRAATERGDGPGIGWDVWECA